MLSLFSSLLSLRLHLGAQACFINLLADPLCKRYAVTLFCFELRLLVSIQFQDLFHSLCRGLFHLSLTVLVHYRSEEYTQAQRVVPLYKLTFSEITRISEKVNSNSNKGDLRFTHKFYSLFQKVSLVYRAITFFGVLFQTT